MYRTLLLVIFFFGIISILLTGCSFYEQRVGEVLGIDPNTGLIVVRGAGVTLNSQSILTSAHTVKSSLLKYTFSGIHYTPVWKDITGDRALMVPYGEEHSGNEHEVPFSPKLVPIGTPVSVSVFRSGSIETISGIVTNSSAQLTGYQLDGTFIYLSGITLIDTSTPLLPGDSGAPIYDREGNLIDIVHVR